MNQTDEWTVGRLLQWTTEFLEKRDAESPRLDAEVLLAQSLGCERIELYTAFANVVDEAPRTRFRELVKRRAAGEPVAYLVGRKEFFSLAFDVSPDVLIPRPETELLVVAALDLAKEHAGKINDIVDVGVGSGAIAVSLARHLQQANIAAVDVSQAALAVAKKNAERHGVAERIEMLESDLLSALPDDRRFDLIVSNPPYVSEGEYENLDAGCREFEPKLALVAGADGCSVIRKLVAQAGDRLRPGGWLLCEISPMIADRVKQILHTDGRFEPAQVLPDLGRRPRVVQVRRLA